MADQQGPQPRILDEAEFSELEDALIAQAPAGLSEQDCERWIGPRLEQAIAEREYGPAKVGGSAAGRMAGGAWEMLNPVNIAKGVGTLLTTDPRETLGAVASGWKQQVDKGAQAGREGRYAEAFGHTAASMIPLVGPLIGDIGEQAGSGDIAGAVGRTAGLVGGPKVYSAVGKGAAKATRAVSQTAAKGLTNPNPVVADAVAYGQREGIPVDAATATGNPVVRGAQYLADRSLGGAAVGVQAARRQEEALAGTSAKLAGRAHPTPITPEQAGEGVRAAIEGRIGRLHGAANKAYGELRAIEAQQGLMVDQTAAKAALAPVLDRIRRQMPLTQQQASPALKALEKHRGRA